MNLDDHVIQQRQEIVNLDAIGHPVHQRREHLEPGHAGHLGELCCWLQDEDGLSQNV